jgi:RNA polymerase sigma-70 factor (ECF subfamily)
MREQARHADATHTNRVVGALRTAVTSCLLRRGIAACDADDAAQETMARVVRRWSLLQSLPSHELLAYSVKCAQRVHIDLRRRTRRDERLVEVLARDEVTQPSPLNIVVARQHLDHITAATSTLPKEELEVLLEVGVRGRTAQETAKVLGVPAGTVASRLRRARAHARGPLADDHYRSQSPVQMRL